jgi:hypothetical protein
MQKERHPTGGDAVLLAAGESLQAGTYPIHRNPNLGVTMYHRSDASLRRIGKKRAKRHGTTAKAYSRKGLRRRWLVHQQAGYNGYANTDLP